MLRAWQFFINCLKIFSLADNPKPIGSKIQQGSPDGYAADDSVALHFQGTRLVEAVSSIKQVSAYKVEMIDGKIREQPLVTRYLGKD